MQPGFIFLTCYQLDTRRLTMRGIRTRALSGLLTVLAGLVLSLLLTGSTWALTATDCATCHGADVVEGHHNTTDPNSDFNQGLCENCHVGITTGNDCSACHTFTLQNNTHHIAQGDTPVNCSQCHTGGADLQNCLGCHAGKVRTRHHQIASAGINCSSCHPAMTQQSSCRDCHGSTQGRHHTYANANNTACTSCHTTLAALPNCQGCHAPGSAREGHHDSGSLCADCHDGTPQVGACADCHQGSNAPSHHASPDYASGNCGACHNLTAIDKTGCRGCHLFGPELNDEHHSNPTYLWTQYQLGCNTCHFFTGSSIPSGLKIGCVSCHESIVHTTGIETTHHRMFPAVQGNCAFCHLGGSTTPVACTDCHGANGNPPTAQTHHATAQAVAGNCSACHAVVPVNASTCSACHAAQAPIADTHHLTTPAQTNQCATCHTGIAPASLACANCHITGATVPIAERHHTSATGQTGTCASCHGQAAPAQIPCSACHSDGNHHLQPQATSGNCAFCHGNTELLGSSCAGCHTAPIPQIHHGDPLTEVGGNCGACHQTINDSSVCANCHASSPHHATTWSTSGDCAHCHAIPAWAADRPAQAACSACHGTNKHNKGGPVQHYGACAACHEQKPFHPYNGSDGGGSSWGDSDRHDSRGGSGPGYDKFNLFVSQNMRRDGDRGAPDNQLKFNKTTISHNGTNYTVPYFSMTYGNLVLNKTASASRAESGYAASKAVDGDVASRWWAKGSTATTVQWLKVDLGTSKSVGKVALRWHSYYAKKYQIQTSTDNSTWTTVFSNTYGAGGMETRTFTARNARYVRIYCQEASSTSGFSLYELEVYAP
jgi:hypothetical protein